MNRRKKEIKNERRDRGRKGSKKEEILQVVYQG